MNREMYHEAGGHKKLRALALEHHTAGTARKPFAKPSTQKQYPRHRPTDVEHLKIRVTLDPEQPKKVSGETEITLRAIAADADHITLDAVAFRNVRVRQIGPSGDSTELSADVRDSDIRVNFGKTLAIGDTLTLAIAYTCEPGAGLYWVVPDAGYPHKPRQIWSQGQDEDNRYWLPCVDVPQERATVEILATVPAKYTAVANGDLVATTDVSDGNKEWHYRLDVPFPSYLISLCVGEFAEISETLTLPSGRQIAVQYFGEKGREDDLRRSFGQTPAMIDFYSRKIGVEYPYSKYAQVAVADFIFGGMENITATTQTDLTLHDARAHLDFKSEPLVSHELAHQWFGDYLTCMEWPHAWLNEGFATYFEALWTEHEDGEDEFRQKMRENAGGYFAEDSGNYRRPLVERQYEAPIDIFDAHLYEKGAWVLHMLRHRLGETGFWRAIETYVKTNAAQNVTTPDLARAIAAATGFDVTQFFDQWVYGAGHPEFEVSYNFDDKTELAELTVKQTQKVEGHTALFSLPVDVRFTGDNGREHRETVTVDSAEHTFRIRVPFKPTTVQFDPDEWVLKSLKFKRPVKMLAAQLTGDAKATRRVDAAKHLAEHGTSEAVDALANALADNANHWSVSAAAAKSLGKINTNAAREALISGLRSAAHPKARKAIVDALGKFRDSAAFTALTEKLRAGDDSYFVEAATVRAIAATRQPGSFDAVQLALTRDSWREVIRSAGLESLGTLDDSRAIDIAENFLPYGKPWFVRAAAARCLAQIGKHLEGPARTRIVDALLPLAEDRHFLTQLSALRALGTLGDSRAIDVLQRVANVAIDGRTKRIAGESVDAVRNQQKLPSEIKDLQKTVDKLQTENRDLKGRLEKIEAMLSKEGGVFDEVKHRATVQLDNLKTAFGDLKGMFDRFTKGDSGQPPAAKN